MIKTFEELVEQANLKGWLVVNCFQFSNTQWRVNLQQKTANGATTNVFTQFADGKTASEAMRCCMANLANDVQATRSVSGKPAPAKQPVKAPPPRELTPEQEKRLLDALTDYTIALQMRSLGAS